MRNNKMYDTDRKTNGDNLNEEIKFRDKCLELDLNLVCFDLDCTATKSHSGGILHNTNLANYIGNASKDFVKVVPLLINAGIRVAILSFTDKRYYSSKRPKEKYIAGEDLISVFLKSLFDEEISKQIYMFGFNNNENKNLHIENAMKHFNIQNKKNVVLFDDTVKNIYQLKDGVRGFVVNRNMGFEFSDFK